MGCYVMVLGRIARDIELKYVQGSGRAFIRNVVAYDRVIKGDKKTIFLDFSIFGVAAENISKYLGKGDQIFLSGELDEDNWTDRDGNNHKTMKLMASSFEFAGHSRKNQSSYDQYTPPPQQQAFAPQVIVEADASNPMPAYEPTHVMPQPQGYETPQDEVPF